MQAHVSQLAAAVSIVFAMASCNETPKPSATQSTASAAAVRDTQRTDPQPTAAASSASTAQTPPSPTRIAAQHILVAYKGAAAAPKGVSRSKDQARQRAQQAGKRAKDGEDFSLLVTEYSEDPTVSNRGNLGLFTRESKDKAFADAAFALPVDGVSDLVETKYGFHIIKRNQ
jgi:peptidyl-prolyl cis-trans isomerase NIMA-interacting 1